MNLMITDYLSSDVMAAIDNMSTFYDEYLDFLGDYELCTINENPTIERKFREYERRRDRIIEEVTSLIDDMSTDERRYYFNTASQISEKLADFNLKMEV